MRNTFIITLLHLCLFANAQNYDTVKIIAVNVAENVYMLKGSGGNIGVLTGPDGTILVDDQFAPLSDKIKDAVKKINPVEIKYVINTHVHGDHSGGNENFKKQGAIIIAQQNVRERMTKETITNSKTTPPRDKDAWPVITFDEQIDFHLNNEDIEVIHFGSGHTDGDAIIHFKKANAFHAGDLFVRYGYPYIDMTRGGGITGFIANLDKILSLLDENSKIIPGHGELATKADVKLFRDKLADIRDNVSKALKKGTKVEEITSLGITNKYDSEWGGFVKGKDFVLFVATSLKAEQAK